MSRRASPVAIIKTGRIGTSTSRGFTLLEAIVAVAIMGIALVPTITFVSQMVGALSRASDANARNLAEQSIIELLEPLNPVERPVGNDQIGDLLIHWNSVDIIPPSKEIQAGVGLAVFGVGFYVVTVSVDRVNQGPWFSFDMRKVGYQKIGSQSAPGAALSVKP